MTSARRIFCTLVCLCIPAVVGAEALLTQARGGLLSGGTPLIAARTVSGQAGSPQSVASLFTGQQGGSLFAPYPARARVGSIFGGPPQADSQIAQVRHIIAQAEAGQLGYDAVQYGATVRPDRPPTDMTIAEIYAWIDATPGQPHAIGRYQFIPPTLRRLVTKVGIDPQARFVPAVQDQLADQLLVEAGWHDFQAGDMGRHAFMNNLAKIWAGLPTSTGLSHYHGYAGNEATMNWADFDAWMAEIFPA